jgi:hypothetical protein
MTTALFKVLKIDELTRLSEAGGVEKFYRHQLKTKGGVVLTVDIGQKDFTPEKAGPILTAEAKNADAILSL